MSEPRSWDEAYQSSPPWDIGEPQPAIAALADAGSLTGTVLDVGCGTGEHAMLAARFGCTAHGVDISPLAIEIARRKAAERGLDVTFHVADALHLETLGLTFDTVIDSGLFHVFDDAERIAYVASLRRVMVSGGRLSLMCFSDKQPGTMGPRRISQGDLLTSFSDGWRVDAIEATQFVVAREPGTAEAWLVTLTRL